MNMRWILRSKIHKATVTEAKAEVDELLRLDPKNSLEKFRKMNPYKNPEHLYILDAG